MAGGEGLFAALVPMKGESERIPGKNLRPMCGRPLCHWILESLASVEAVDTVVVNTDSEEIARSVTSAFDVVVHERPDRLRGHGVPMNRILRHDVDRLSDRQLFVQTHATNPLLRPRTIERALDRFLAEGAHDSLFSVTRHQARFWDAGGRPVNHDPTEPLVPTQALDPLFEENSSLYVFSRGSLTATGQRIGERPVRFEMPRPEAVDIDEPEDWEMAEALLRARLPPEGPT